VRSGRKGEHDPRGDGTIRVVYDDGFAVTEFESTGTMTDIYELID
jgi:hypothetical protein